jgi:hypothetical protein
VLVTLVDEPGDVVIDLGLQGLRLSGSRTRPWCLASGFKLPPRTR